MESLDEVIHKKKEAKKKATDLQSIVYRLQENTRQHSDSQGQLDNRNGQQSTVSTDKPSLPNQQQAIYNAEVDNLLEKLVMDGLLAEEYIPWAAKRVHKLGIFKVNRLAINARNGRNPKHLFIWKLNGAYQAAYKRDMMDR